MGLYADGVDLVDAVAGVLNVVDGLVQADLLHELLPQGIVIVDDADILALFVGLDEADQGQAAVNAPVDAVAVLGEGGTGVGQVDDHVGGGGDFHDGSPALGPVGTGEVLDSAGDELVDVHILQSVLHVLRIGLDVLGGHVDDLGAAGVKALALVDQDQGLGVGFLGGEDVVDRLMGAVADGKVVVAGVQHPGALGPVGLDGVLIVARGIAGVEDHGDFLGGAGLQDTGLAEADQLQRGLLQPAGGVRSLHIELDHVLAGNVAGVGDLHNGLALAADLEVNALELLLEGGVGQAVAEGVGNLGGVVPGAGDGARVGVGIALAEDRVLVTGLIVLVALVDALGLHQIGVAAVIEGDAAVAEGVPGVEVNAEVHHRGGGDGADGVGVGQLAGRRDVAGEHVGQAQAAVHAQIADPEEGVHIRILLELFNFHGAGGVEQDDELAAVLLGHGDHIALVAGQGQRTLKAVAVHGGDHVGMVVGGFGVVAGDEHDGYGAVGGGEQLVAVGLGRRLAHVVGGEVLGHGGEHRGQDVTGDGHTEEQSRHAVGIHGGIRVELDEVLVHGEASGRQRLLEAVHGLARVPVDDGGGAHHAAQNGVVGVHTPQGDGFAFLVQGQRAVVLEQDDAFGGDFRCELGLRGDHVLQGSIVGDKTRAGVVVVGILDDDFIVAGAEHAVDFVCPAVTGGLCGEGEHHKRRHNRRKTTPDAFLCHISPPLLIVSDFARRRMSQV